MNFRKIIYGIAVLLTCVLLFQCNKQAKQNQHAEVTKAVDAAKAGQFDKIDPKVMREVMKLYKQPTLPPLTTPPQQKGQANSNLNGCHHCEQILAQGTTNPTPAPASASAPAPAQNPVSQNSAALTQPAIVSAQPAPEPHKSYIAPIEDKGVSAQQPANAKPAGTN